MLIRHIKGLAERSETSRLVGRILGENFRPNLRPIVIGSLFLVLLAATTASLAWLMRDIVNEVFVRQNVAMLWVLVASVLGLFMIKGWAAYMQANIFARVGNGIVAHYQQRIYDHLLKLPVSFFAESTSSDLITRVSFGAQSARQIVDLVVQSVARDFITLISLVFVMTIQAPVMALIGVLVGPLAIYGTLYLSGRVRKLTKQEIVSTAEIFAVLQETALGTRVLKSFGLERHMRGRMQVAVRSVEGRANKIAALQARTAPLMETVTGLAIATVIATAGWQAIVHHKSPGEFMSFITALLLAYEPAKRLARLHVQLTSGLAGVRMMTELLDTPEARTELKVGPPLCVNYARVHFKNVSFAYRADVNVLNDVSFSARRGQIVALVGPTGCGKSTILSLLQRFYDPAEGEILIDGQDIRNVCSASLRDAISYVSQDMFLFSGTIRENIRLGRLEATDAEVAQAVKDAFADDFVRALPNGLDTWAGENGVQLSGGQRQRLSIARALLKDAPIVLFDEATSALDAETESWIQLSLSRLMADKMVMVIAHRLSTVREADLILVIESGRIVEQGTHDSLIRSGGHYDRFSRLQLRGSGQDKLLHSPPHSVLEPAG